MLLSDLVAVAEHFGDKGRRHLRNELPKSRIARALQINAERSKSVHDRLRIDVSPRPAAREQPRCADGTAGGALIGSVIEVIVQLRCEGLRDGDGFVAERDAGLAVNSCDGDGLEGGDLGEGLGVEQ